MIEDIEDIEQSAVSSHAIDAGRHPLPRNCMTHKTGAHEWCDFGFGVSLAMNVTPLILSRLVLLALVSATLVCGDVDYTFEWCNSDNAQSCGVQAVTRTPTAAELVGFTQATFAQYYAPFMQGMTGSFHAPIRDSNANGVMIGPVWGPNLIFTQFIFWNGALLCCYDDSWNPFWLYDINDNNLVVATNYGRGSVVNSRFAINGRIFDALTNTTSHIRIVNDHPTDDVPARFEAIDNSNRIFGKATAGNFVLTPVPEPTSIVLLATVAIGALWTSRRCKRTPPA